MLQYFTPEVLGVFVAATEAYIVGMSLAFACHLSK